MTERINLDWLDAFADAVNSDEEMTVIGDWFTVSFSIDFGDQRIVVHMRQGRVDEIVRDPRFDVSTAFGISAPCEVWTKHFKPVPPPLYHDVFPMIMREPNFQLQGDSLIAMQHARALHRTLSIMRQAGAGHA